MILKYVDNKISNDKFIKAGLSAEKQMNHYLERDFGKNKDIMILNDIRLVDGGNTAQIDHLVIHQCGFIIIESKSVSSKISVNKYGEWKRIFNNRETGMPSPIQQAKRQVSFLRDFLNQKVTNLFREKLIYKFTSKPTFNNYKFDVLVAISDSGIIERDNIDLPEVVKADSVPDKINSILSKRKKGILNPFANDNYTFTIDTVRKIANTLLALHKPVSTQTIERTNSVQEEPIKYNKSKDNMAKYICSKCASKNIQIEYGRYGYYFKCLDCNCNTSIKHTCTTSKCKIKTRKRKNKFFKVCENCDVEVLFWENKTIS